MSHDRPTPHELLERAVSALRDDAAPDATVEAAADRVWQRLWAETTAGPPIHGCEDYQKLLPAYLAGDLPEARALLVREHTRQCLPCRRALKTARDGGVAAAPQRPAATAAGSSTVRRWLLPLAATLAVALAGLGGFLLGGFSFGPPPVLATVQSLDGTLLEVGTEGPQTAVVASGAAIFEGERVRTAKDSGAVLRLTDGSRIEMSERAELSLDKGLSGTTIHLDRGRIIVEAVKQKHGRLYVATEDCMVSVVGTVFSVNHGLKGSRVSVIEGEVRVARAGGTDVLLPGQQVTTDPALAPVPVRQEIAWSRNQDRYAALLEELAALSRELGARVSQPGRRDQSRLLELAPAETAVWLAAPNLAETLDQTYQVLLDRVGESPVLGQWWQESVVEPGLEPEISAFVTRVRDLGSYLGPEIAFAVPARAFGAPDGPGSAPLILAEVIDASLPAYLEQEIERIRGEAGHEMLFLVDDPAQAGTAAEGLWIWVGGGVLVATPSPELLRNTAARVTSGAAGGFAGTPFHQRLVEVYRDGVEWLLGADLERMGVFPDTQVRDRVVAAEGTGMEDLRYLLIERHSSGEVAETSARLTFAGPRHGVASWLAAPAPMGALDFVSAEAHAVTAVAFKDPIRMLDDLAPLMGSKDLAEELDRAGAELGVDLRDDVAASLGGELAFAFDGPVLPKPSWKLVVEVYDPARFQSAFEALARRAEAEATASGHAATFEHSAETDRGRTFYTLRIVPAEGWAHEIHYLFDDGYLVAAPSRVLLQQALAVRDSGSGLVSSERFRRLLPQDGEAYFSALAFQDLGELSEPLAGLTGPGGGDSGGGSGELLAALQGMPATLGFAYGHEDSIEVAFTSPGGPLGLGVWSMLPSLARLGELAGGMEEMR